MWLQVPHGPVSHKILKKFLLNEQETLICWSRTSSAIIKQLQYCFTAMSLLHWLKTSKCINMNDYSIIFTTLAFLWSLFARCLPICHFSHFEIDNYSIVFVL